MSHPFQVELSRDYTAVVARTHDHFGPNSLEILSRILWYWLFAIP
jgi:hypothetical protein